RAGPPGRASGQASGDPLANRALLDGFVVGDTLEDPADVDAGGVDLVGLELSGVDQLFDLGDGNLGGGGHHRVEVARRLSVDEVAEAIAAPGFDDGEVGGQRLL